MNVVILKININTGHVNLSYDQMLQQSKNVHFVFRAIVIHNFLPMIIIITLFFLYSYHMPGNVLSTSTFKSL